MINSRKKIDGRRNSNHDFERHSPYNRDYHRRTPPYRDGSRSRLQPSVRPRSRSPISKQRSRTPVRDRPRSPSRYKPRTPDRYRVLNRESRRESETLHNSTSRLSHSDRHARGCIEDPVYQGAEGPPIDNNELKKLHIEIRNIKGSSSNFYSSEEIAPPRRPDTLVSSMEAVLSVPFSLSFS